MSRGASTLGTSPRNPGPRTATAETAEEIACRSFESALEWLRPKVPHGDLGLVAAYFGKEPQLARTNELARARHVAARKEIDARLKKIHLHLAAAQRANRGLRGAWPQAVEVSIGGVLQPGQDSLAILSAGPVRVELKAKSVLTYRWPRRLEELAAEFEKLKADFDKEVPRAPGPTTSQPKKRQTAINQRTVVVPCARAILPATEITGATLAVIAVALHIDEPSTSRAAFEKAEAKWRKVLQRSAQRAQDQAR